ncbi:radical SAM protein [Polymorphospora sp. NPDC050346]|uniref:radical SAM/SPASM domain-containing protein n=1 Tax=Polymorphospora sp. NPDC050346 TaxID=3155780 RepID=UPI0033F0128C
MKPEKVTRYKVISRKSYIAPGGDEVRLVYATRISKVLPVKRAVADDLEAGRVPAIGDQQLEALRRYQLLVPADENELEAVNQRFNSNAADLGRRHVALLPTAYCNMGCTYCGQTHRRTSLRGNHREAVRRRVLAMLEHPQTRAMRLDWFGGEPLMGFAAIRDLSQSFVPVVDQRELDWTSVIVTNGALLDIRKIKVLAEECRVTHAEITIDGPPEMHDRHRPLKSGETSFWRIVEAVTQALDDESTAGMTFGIRSNVDVHNEDSITELLELLAAHGFAHPRVRFGIKPVHSWSNDVSAIEVGKRHFADREAQWLKIMRRLGLNCEILPPAPTEVVCPAASRSDELIAPDGDVFSCSEQPLVDQLADTAVGHVTQPWADNAGPRPLGAYDDWTQDVAAGQRSCSSCEFYPTCGGACPKLWRDGHVPCPSYKFNTQQRLNLIADLNGLTATVGAAR